jgi:hypothetical protein
MDWKQVNTIDGKDRHTTTCKEIRDNLFIPARPFIIRNPIIQDRL